MDNREPDTSFLDDCRIFLVGENIETSNYITRTIIKLARDMSPFMPQLSRVIENCGYSPRSKTIAFRYHEMPVVVARETITINGMRDKETAKVFLDWLKEKIKNAG
jgi:ArsR family metal-binding transcriptional regulator